MKTTKIGICFGGYCPLHQGHLDVIMKAKKECDITYVFVCGYDNDRGGEILPLKKRYNIIRNFLKDDTVRIKMIDDSALGIDESMSDSNWDIWLTAVFTQILDDGYTIDDIDYTFYVAEKEYVKALKKHGCGDAVYLDRKKNPVSGTLCRTQPLKYWDKITQPFRSYYSHNILIAGTASEGKTTLVHDIGKYFNIPYSYEKGRDICHTKTDDEFNFKDFVYNITAQNDYNETLIASPQNPGVFISDTDNMVTLMYAMAYKDREGFSLSSEEYLVLYGLAWQFRKTIKWDKIFLIKPHKKPIVDDGERYMPDSDYNIRLGFYENLKKLYTEFGYEFEEIDGDYEHNFETVKSYIKGLFETK